MEQLKLWAPEDLWQLREQLDRMLGAPPPRPIEDELEYKLLEAGRLSEIKPPMVDLTPY